MPDSQRKRRLKGRASVGLLARPLKAGCSHFRMFVCEQAGGAGLIQLQVVEHCVSGVLERSGGLLGRARRVASILVAL